MSSRITRDGKGQEPDPCVRRPSLTMRSSCVNQIFPTMLLRSLPNLLCTPRRGAWTRCLLRLCRGANGRCRIQVFHSRILMSVSIFHVLVSCFCRHRTCIKLLVSRSRLPSRCLLQKRRHRHLLLKFFPCCSLPLPPRQGTVGHMRWLHPMLSSVTLMSGHSPRALGLGSPGRHTGIRKHWRTSTGGSAPSSRPSIGLASQSIIMKSCSCTGTWPTSQAR